MLINSATLTSIYVLIRNCILVSQTTNILTTLNPTQYFHAAMIHVDYCNSNFQSYKNIFRNTPTENKHKTNVDVDDIKRS